MEQWWYAVGDERSGPIELTALHALFHQGVIDTRTLAWHSGMPEWQRIGDIAALADLVQPRQADAPPPLFPAPQAPASATESSAATLAGPWRRFLARSIDMLIIGIAWNILGRLTAGQIPLIGTTSIIAGLLVTPVILLLEAVFFASMGWTPGKKLLGVSVRTLDGSHPTMAQTARRMVGLWWYGLGAGVPIVNLIAMTRQYRHLGAGQVLVWDRERFEVLASAPGNLRWVIALAAMVLLLMVYLVLALAD